MSRVKFDESVGNSLLRYARMLVSRGYVHNSLGNLAIRVPHAEFEHGVVYTKHAEVSLEEMTLDNVVVTDVPTPALLHGTVPDERRPQPEPGDSPSPARHPRRHPRASR